MSNEFSKKVGTIEKPQSVPLRKRKSKIRRHYKFICPAASPKSKHIAVSTDTSMPTNSILAMSENELYSFTDEKFFGALKKFGDLLLTLYSKVYSAYWSHCYIAYILLMVTSLQRNSDYSKFHFLPTIPLLCILFFAIVSFLTFIYSIVYYIYHNKRLTSTLISVFLSMVILVRIFGVTYYTIIPFIIVLCASWGTGLIVAFALIASWLLAPFWVFQFVFVKVVSNGYYQTILKLYSFFHSVYLNIYHFSCHSVVNIYKTIGFYTVFVLCFALILRSSLPSDITLVL